MKMPREQLEDIFTTPSTAIPTPIQTLFNI